MSSVHTLTWSNPRLIKFAILFAILGFRVFCRSGGKGETEKLKQRDLVPQSRQQMKGIPQKFFDQEFQALEMLGFRQIVEYSKAGYNSLMRRNFTSTLVSPDRTVKADVSYFHDYSLASLVASLFNMQWLVVMKGTYFVSYFENGTRLITSTFFKVNKWEPTTTVIKLPKGVSLQEIYQRHRHERDAIARAKNIRPIELSSAETVLALCNDFTAKTASHIEENNGCKGQCADTFVGRTS